MVCFSFRITTSLFTSRRHFRTPISPPFTEWINFFKIPGHAECLNCYIAIVNLKKKKTPERTRSFPFLTFLNSFQASIHPIGIFHEQSPPTHISIHASPSWTQWSLFQPWFVERLPRRQSQDLYSTLSGRIPSSNLIQTYSCATHNGAMHRPSPPNVATVRCPFTISGNPSVFVMMTSHHKLEGRNREE